MGVGGMESAAEAGGGGTTGIAGGAEATGREAVGAELAPGAAFAADPPAWLKAPARSRTYSLGEEWPSYLPE